VDHPNYPLRTALAFVLLFAPLVISRLGFGTKRFWGGYAFSTAAFFGVFAVAGWIVRVGMDIIGELQLLRPVGEFAGVSFVFAFCAFCGGAFAESAAGKMQRF
jgi:hypothetical protein